MLQELVAAEWVGMLKHGVLDADIYPDKATLIIDMLWSVTANPSARVSGCLAVAIPTWPEACVRLLTVCSLSKGESGCLALAIPDSTEAC